MQDDITVSAKGALIEKARARPRLGARRLRLSSALAGELRRRASRGQAWLAQQLETMEKLRHMSA